MILLDLFLVYFQIGLFAFGGGYAAMPLIQSLVVNQKGWLSISEFADLTTIAEMTPGPILINSATFVGQKMAGLPGALVCSLGSVLPSFIIVFLLSYLYKKFKDVKVIKSILNELRPAITAMIASAGLTLLLLAIFQTNDYSNLLNYPIQWIECLLFGLSLFVLRKFKVSPILVIVSVTFIGTILYSTLS